MEYEILARFLLAALWGGIVGAEREYRSKSAGFRTMIMISVGSCFFTMMSVWIGAGNNSDRIASNIVTGIGFLGAGVIFKGDNRVNGITTAATIWTVAAVGMGIGAGYYIASACASILVLIILSVLPYFENLIDGFNQTKIYSISTVFAADKTSGFEQLLGRNKLNFKLTGQVRDGKIITTTWQVSGRAKNHQIFIDTVINDETVIRFEY
jgi:putative Mg2+ transporter-C (MgtC) family protein